MPDVISKLEQNIAKENLTFTKKPILIAGMAMEYYNIRKTGNDIDMIVCDEDYHRL